MRIDCKVNIFNYIMIKQDIVMIKLVLSIRCQQKIMQLVDFFEC